MTVFQTFIGLTLITTMYATAVSYRWSDEDGVYSHKETCIQATMLLMAHIKFSNSIDS